MRLLRFRKLADNSIRIQIHLDETKTLEGGEPDPAWVYDLTWPPKPSNATATDYRDMVKREAKLLAELELAKRQAGDDEGTAVAGGGEGEPL
jgi:hypothetical protein